MPSVPDVTTNQFTAFRQAEKHFKNRAVKDKYPSLRKYQESLVDLSRPEQQEDDVVWKAGWWSPDHEPDACPNRTDWKPWLFKGKEKDKGTRPDLPTSDLKPIQLNDGRTGWIVAPGCILIPRFLSCSEQLHFLHSSLAEYTLPPNPLSLSTHYDLPSNLFELYTHDPDTVVQPKHRTFPASQTRSSATSDVPKSRTLIETEPASIIGYDEIVARNKTWTGDAPSDKLKEKTVDQLILELRWANLGWVYQWSTKSYDFSREEPIPFPPELAAVCHQVVASVPWHRVFSEGDDSYACGWENWAEDYAPDTGIVNFYQARKDTLMGHVDRSELDPARPLVSLSLGYSAILLLGSASRHDPPKPIIMRSGDCLIMSGSGRQAYHGVPRILEGTLPSHFAMQDRDSETMKAAKRFISSARININARQVFPPGFVRPDRE